MHNYVVIPTVGRVQLLGLVLVHTIKYLPKGWRIIVVGADEGDIPNNSEAQLFSEFVDFYVSSKGASAQRNFGVSRAIVDANLIVFLDDDFIVDEFYFKTISELFDADADIVGVNTSLLLDGATNQGYDFNYALDRLKAHRVKTMFTGYYEVSTLYGCNMAVRADALRQFSPWFDPMLPLYSWLEDRDFSHKLKIYGRLVRTKQCLGVHLGFKQGRTSGIRYGYSQIVNPIYLYRKGSLSFSSAVSLVGRPFFMNVVRYGFPEKWIDRRGRLIGNFYAFRDILNLTLDPTKILRM
ncbi:glycosyltransferase [Curvibacter sp. HBC61]|uniref:Glycosyltransferase n=1 Tax=Curvibacter cyanobacteriorum TaxID=3026422 RepID=A0ABT5MW21_9BURK|nr:glycosyltransferase [Curvibacter sp. HBC61]MDD0838244.1 glycosyltransferase [Curvibacter sp. HBC61]